MHAHTHKHWQAYAEINAENIRHVCTPNQAPTHADEFVSVSWRASGMSMADGRLMFMCTSTRMNVKTSYRVYQLMNAPCDCADGTQSRSPLVKSWT